MTEVLDAIPFEEEKPSIRKVFFEKTIWPGAFLGGPLMAGFMIAENYKTLGEAYKAKQTWWITGIFTVLLFYMLFQIPAFSKIPSFIIPALYAGVTLGVFKSYQGKKVQSFLETGGKKHPWGYVIGISCLFLAISLVLALFMGFLFSTIHHTSLSSKTYGEAVKNEISYNASEFSEEEIDQIAQGLKYLGFFDEMYPKYVHVEGEKETFIFTISVYENIIKDTEQIELFTLLRDDLENYFNQKVVLKLVVGYLNNVLMTIE